MTKSKIFLYFCLSLIGGIFLSSFIKIPELVLLGFLIFGILLISVYWPKKKIIVLGFCILILVLGIYRCQQFLESGIMPSELRNFNDQGESSFIGVIGKEPDRRSDKTKLEIKSEKVRIGDNWEKVSGKVLVTTRKYPEYQYGDELEITGKLQTPKVFEDFNYRGYLAKDGIYSVVYYPEIELTGENYGNKFYKTILAFKNKIRSKIETLLSPPEISILEAVTLGDKQRLSEELKDKLNITGTRHIVAISGMHIIILSQILMFVLLSLGLWRQQAFYFVLVLLVLFIIMVGAPASAIRAGIMAGILLVAHQIGRLNSSVRAIIFAAAIMLFINPLLLRFDVGFQLSFLAVLGIIYFKPWLDNVFKRLPESFGTKDVVAMTFSAQIATLPILIYNFGRISFISPLANVLIVPLLPCIMAIGLFFNLFTITWFSLGKILVWPTWFAFAYITKIVDWFSRLPFAAKEISNIHWGWVVGYYVLLIGFLWWYKKKKPTDFLPT